MEKIKNEKVPAYKKEGPRPMGKYAGGKDGEIVEVDGKKYKKVKTSWTEKNYYKHPGPGWDHRGGYLEGLGFSELEAFNDKLLDELSDLPFFNLELIEE